MNGMKRIKQWAALLWLLPGCTSLDQLITQDAGEVRDTEIEQDASTPTVEVDASDPPPEPRACSASSQCGADEICGPVGQCMPRCTWFDACVVVETPRDIVAIASDENAVYWALAPSRDSVGNPEQNGELWRMVPGQAPVQVADQLGDAWEKVRFALADGFAYFVRGRELHRRVVDASRPSERVYTFPTELYVRWVVGHGFIVMNGGGHGADATKLFIGSADGSRPLRALEAGTAAGDHLTSFAIEGDRLYIVESNDSSQLTLKSLRLVEPSIPTTHARELSTGYLWGSLGLHERTFLLSCSGDAVCSINLDTGVLRNAAGRPGAAGQPFKIGEWVYWYEAPLQDQSEGDSRLARYSLHSIGTSQTLLERDAAQIVSSVGVVGLGNQLYTVPQEGDPGAPQHHLIYAMPLPPEPCTADLPCPSGKTCGTDALCH